jgi:hypothetical protein
VSLDNAFVLIEGYPPETQGLQRKATAGLRRD